MDVYYSNADLVNKYKAKLAKKRGATGPSPSRALSPRKALRNAKKTKRGGRVVVIALRDYIYMLF